jgi:hypothetical protein
MTLNQIIHEYEQPKKAAAEKVKRFVVDWVLTNAPKGFESVSWEQYTPFFNDGNECEFGVHSGSNTLEYNGRSDWDEELPNFRVYEYRDITNEQELKSCLEVCKRYCEPWEVEDTRIGTRGPFLMKDPHPIGIFCYSFIPMIKSIPGELLKEAFGDSKIVTIDSRGKITTEHCYHE